MSTKPTLIIDLRPLQHGHINGVTISSRNWINSLLKSNKFKVIFWSNSFKKFSIPKEWETFRHIHTCIPNIILNLSFTYLNFPNINKLTGVKNGIYLCTDLRPFKVNKKTKSIIYIHDIAFIVKKEAYSIKSKLWYKLIKPKKIFKKANLIITNSEFSKKEIIKMYGKRDIKVIAPYLDKQWYLKKKLINKKRKKYFVVISTLQSRKNIKNTIEGFKKFNETQNSKYKLIVIGKQENTFKKEKYTKQKNIIYTGQVSEKTKIKLIGNALGLAYLSTYEGFGLPILEAGLLSTPALVSKSSPFVELYKKSVVYCDPYDTNSIKEGFHILMNTSVYPTIKSGYPESEKNLIQTILHL